MCVLISSFMGVLIGGFLTALFIMSGFPPEDF
jgi:hypothetical protein